MPITLSFRPAQTTEAPQLSQFALQSKSYWPHDANYLKKCETLLTIPTTDIENGLVTVAESENQIVGFFVLKFIENENRLYHFWVHPQFIRRGIGTKMMAEVRMKAKLQDLAILRSIIDPFSEEFFVKMGATVLKRVESLVQPGLFVPYVELRDFG